MKGSFRDSVADTSLRALAMTPCEMVLCAAPAYLAAYPAPYIPPVAPAQASPTGLRAMNGRLKGGREQLRWLRLMARSTNVGHALRIAALAGLGIILQPRMLLQDYIDEGLLVPLLRDWRHAVRPMHILTAPDRRRTRKPGSFVEFIARRFPLRGQ